MKPTNLSVGKPVTLMTSITQTLEDGTVQVIGLKGDRVLVRRIDLPRVLVEHKCIQFWVTSDHLVGVPE